jgi:hypothetical protein
MSSSFLKECSPGYRIQNWWFLAKIEKCDVNSFWPP